MKNIDKDIATPLVLLVVYAMFAASETMTLPDTIGFHNSTLFYKPIIWSGNIFLRISNILWFSIPAVLLIFAVREKDLFLSTLFILGAIPFMLTNNIILFLNLQVLYGIKIILCYILVGGFFWYIVAEFNRQKLCEQDKIPGDDDSFFSHHEGHEETRRKH